MPYYVLCLLLLSLLLHVPLSRGSATLLFYTDSECQDSAPSILNGTGDGRCTAIHESFGSFEIDQIDSGCGGTDPLALILDQSSQADIKQ